MENMLLVEDRVVLVDLEMARKPETLDREYDLRCTLGMFMRDYARFLKAADESD